MRARSVFESFDEKSLGITTGSRVSISCYVYAVVKINCIVRGYNYRRSYHDSYGRTLLRAFRLRNHTKEMVVSKTGIILGHERAYDNLSSCRAYGQAEWKK